MGVRAFIFERDLYESLTAEMLQHNFNFGKNSSKASAQVEDGAINWLKDGMPRNGGLLV